MGTKGIFIFPIKGIPDKRSSYEETSCYWLVETSVIYFCAVLAIFLDSRVTMHRRTLSFVIQRDKLAISACSL